MHPFCNLQSRARTHAVLVDKTNIYLSAYVIEYKKNIIIYKYIFVHCMTLEFRVLACNKHENVAVFNWWMGLFKKSQDLFKDKPNNTDMDSHTEYLNQMWRFPHT